MRKMAERMCHTPMSVYVMRNDFFGVTKVGIARRPEQRKQLIERITGMDIDLVYQTEPLATASMIESRALKKLAPKRRHGEWFTVDAYEAIALVQSILCDIHKHKSEPGMSAVEDGANTEPWKPEKGRKRR